MVETQSKVNLIKNIFFRHLRFGQIKRFQHSLIIGLWYMRVNFRESRIILILFSITF